MVGPIITVLNRTGEAFCNYAVPMLVQSSILIAVLLAVDFVLRRRVRAVFRYCIWMLVFVKLILPPSLCLPTGIGYWLGDHLSVGSAVSDSPDLSATESTKAIPSFAVSSGFQILPSSEMPVETVAPAAPAVPPLPPLSWPATVFLAWFVGFLLLSGLLIQRVWFVKALIAQSQAAKAEVVDIVSDCRRRLGIRKNIELRISPNALSPATCGLFQPRILLPASMLSQLSGQRLRMVLIHELAHIKRGDLWVNFVQTVLQMIYFYNPLLWLANAVVRRVREQAVDEMVLASLGEEARDYSRTLVDVAEIAFMRPALGLRLIGVVESRKALTARLRHIAARPFPKTTKLGIVGLIAVIAIAAILLPMAKAENRDGGEPAYHEDGRRISPTGEPDEATEDDLLENIPPFMHRPDRDRALISALVRTEFQDKVKGTDAAMEAGWQLLDGFYQQICNQRNLRKLSHNLPKVIEAHQRLRYHPQKPRRGYWITNRQIREELTQQEKDTVLATFEGGQVTLEDWFGALSELPPPRRPKDLDTPGQVERLFDNVLKMSILVAEAESRGLDEDEDFLRMMNERPKALRHRFRMPHPDGLTYPRNTIDILPMHVPHGAIGRDPRDMAVYEQLEKTVDLSDLTPEMPFDQALDILKGSVEPPLNIVVLWEDLSENAGIDPNTPINMGPLPAVQLKTALELLMSALVSDDAEIRFVVQEAAIYVATAGTLPKMMVTRVYDVSSLVGLPMTGGYGRGYGGGGYGGYGGLPGGYGGYGMGGYSYGYGPGYYASDPNGEAARRIRVLARLIVQTIEPDSWADPAGDGNYYYVIEGGLNKGNSSYTVPQNTSGKGTMGIYPNNKLVIYQTPEIHTKIANLLQEMISTVTNSIQIEARFVVVPPGSDEIRAFLEKQKTRSVRIAGHPSISCYCVDFDQTQQLLRLTQATPQSAMLAAPRVTVSNGETATLSVTSGEIEASPLLVSGDMNDIDYGESNQPSRRPNMTDACPLTDLMFAVTPILAPDNNSILLTLGITLSDSVRYKTYITQMPLADGTVVEYEQELPATEAIWDLQTRVSVPNGRTLFIAGKKVKTRGKDGGSQEKNLLILIKPDKAEPHETDAEALEALEGQGYSGYRKATPQPMGFPRGGYEWH